MAALAIPIVILGSLYILSEQEKDGSWFGRWGTNYIYGTWSTLSALALLDFPQKEKVFSLFKIILGLFPTFPAQRGAFQPKAPLGSRF